eukprot:TRINITY_DN33987_c0_g1_i1.p1 TRINITY_DN33987_c0_g1~~TRINITY_DN33987_c0_g1_i1.p1  ORF type:complete len:122 (+),score=13.63 TRINITY_DN33987_c0_g1_i1:388-753(+)
MIGSSSTTWLVPFYLSSSFLRQFAPNRLCSSFSFLFLSQGFSHVPAPLLTKSNLWQPCIGFFWFGALEVRYLHLLDSGIIAYFTHKSRYASSPCISFLDFEISWVFGVGNWGFHGSLFQLV